MGSCLIVANQTLGGDELDRAIRERIDRGESTFHILVPMTPAQEEASAWKRGFSLGEFGWASPDQTERGEPAGELVLPMRARESREVAAEHARGHGAALEEAERRARRRLAQMIERIRSAGGQAEGELGAADPVEATRVLLQRRAFDEVIVSTLPSGLSRWLRMDLPRRVARMTDAPVVTVEAER